jgi:NAD(P)-dependent dehydrogenase (short-subunit alcohol dehydrogenase family)
MQVDSDTKAVVTGAGGGIGQSIAQWLAKRGASVVVSDIDGPAAERVAAGIRDEFGTRAMAVVTDVSKLEEVEELAKAAYDAFGRVDILCNNAGVTMRPFRASWDAAYSDFKWMMDVNWWGVVHGHMAFVPRMRETPGRKHIVNTSSMATQFVVAGHSAYSAAKAAVDGFSRVARTELETQNIGVSLFFPGAVRTRIGTSERLRPEQERSDTRTVKPWSDYAPPTAKLNPIDPNKQDPDFPPDPYTYITPEQTGRMVIEGILENKPYIMTHPPPADVFEADLRAMLDAGPSKGE